MSNLAQTQMGYIWNLPHIAKRIYPNTKGLKVIKKNVRFCMWGLVNPQPLKTMLNLLSCPAFKELLVRRPDMLEKPLKPYVCVNWTCSQRTQNLADHLHMMEAFFGESAVQILSGESKPLLQFADRDGAIYKLKLFTGEVREGSLGLKLTNADDQHIYSVTFNLSAPNGVRTMHIGALQGPSDKLNNRQDTIKLLTKATHGLRTKALMVEFALMFAKLFAIEEVQGVSNQGHIYQALRYLVGSKGKAVSFNYDQLWQEYGAIAVDKFLFSIPVNPERKDPAELKKTKRKLYEKRYAWLAEMEAILHENVRSLRGCVNQS